MDPEPYNRILWLASYPKSGNTWFRVFLANLFSNQDAPVDINELEGGPIASSRQLFDEATGLSSADLTGEEIENLRPLVYEYLAKNSSNTIFHKIHDAYTYTQEGIPLIPEKATKGVIYFIRNPLDVAVSFAHHANSSFQKIVSSMADDQYAFCSKPSRLHMQLRQRLLSWSNHIHSWVDHSGLPVHVVRYEDMIIKPVETFSMAIQFCGLSYNQETIIKALSRSEFKNLQKQEEDKGFREKSPESDKFFRKGIIGSWKEELPEDLIGKIITDHREMMFRFGYLSDSGNLNC